MTITRMLGLRQLLGRPVTRRTAVVAAGAPVATFLDALTHSGPSYNPTASTKCIHGDHFACHAAHDDSSVDDLVAASEAEGRIARTTQRLERLAADLDARHQRYAWTEQLRQDLLAIAHDTPPSMEG